MENERVSDQTGGEKKHKNGMNKGGPAELKDALGDVTSSLNDLYRAADAFATEHARERPYVLLGVAAGIGFILGGGLASRVGGALLGVGTRMATSRLLEELTAAR